MARILTISLFLFFSASLQGQDGWSLERCINHALEHSLSIEQSKLTLASNKIQLKQSKAARYPNLNGGIGFFEQFGRTIDPTTNSFANKKIGSSNFNLSSGVVLFNAGRINNTIRQAQINLESATWDAKGVANDLALNVALVYLQILFAEDQVDNTKSKLAIAKAQLKRTQALIKSGSLAKNEALNFEAQLATSEQSLIIAENTLSNAYLQLKQMLRLDTEDEIQIERPDVSLGQVDPDQFNTERVYQKALMAQPNIKASEHRIKSSVVGKKIAKSQLYPSLSLSGSFSSNVSTLSRKLDGTRIISTTQPVKINGNPASLEIPQLIPNFIDNPFGDQLTENFGQSIGLRLNIPIYQNGRTTASIQQSEIRVLQTKVANEQIKQKLKSDIQKSITDAQSAKRQYTAAEKSAKATQAVFENTQKKFDIGAASSFELTTSKTNADVAQSQFTSSKYNYLFKLKIIDYYLGKPIKL